MTEAVYIKFYNELGMEHLAQKIDVFEFDGAVKYTRAQPKYKRVDLDGIKKKIPTGSVAFKQNETSAVFTNAFKNEYNRAIDDIKSKYGDLYTMEGE